MVRRLVVSSYVEKDPYDLRFEQVTKHFAIYEQSNSSEKRKLHRHFLQIPDGAILEMFDQFSKSSFATEMSQLENLLGEEGNNVHKKTKKSDIFSGLSLA